MNRADSPKPPLAPKPKTATSFTPITTPKFPSSPRPEGLHSPNSMSRGPKPPIAPKPRLAAPHEWRASVYVIGGLNKCSNGRLLCVDAGLFQDHRPDPELAPAEADGPPLRDGEPQEGDGAENAGEAPPSPAGEEATEVAEDSGAEETPGADGGAEEDGACDPSPEEQLGQPSPQHLEDGDPLGGEEFWGDVALAHDCAEAPAAPTEETQPPEVSLEEEQEQEEQEEEEEEEEGVSEGGHVDAEPDLLKREDPGDLSEGAVEGTTEEPPRHEVATDSPMVSEEQEHGGVPSTDQQNDQEEALGQEEKQDPGVPVGDHPEEEDPHHGMDTPEEEEDPRHGTEPPEEEEAPCHGTEPPEEEGDPRHGTESPEEEGDPHHGMEPPEEEDPRHGTEPPEEEGDPRHGTEPPEEEAAEDSCQIIPFESDGPDEPVATLPGSPYQFLPTESTSFCSGHSCPPAAGAGPEAAACGDGTGAEPDPVANSPCASLPGGPGEGPPVPDVVLMSETPDSLTHPYEVGAPDPATEQPGAWAGAPSGKEDSTSEAEGSLAPLDRKNVMTRARPHSGKLAGCVPETVPEESGPEAALSALSLRGGPEEARRLPSEGKPPAAEAAGRALPAKPRAFPLYPRSLSVEGRELPVSAYREPEGCSLDGRWMPRKDDNLSLPCVIGSSGSFSQRTHLPSSGTSTPSSVVDIPPPFDLACITKKPITKSSPSLLIGSDPSDKQPKKKKSSFKRFLALTFKKKAESKGHGDAHGSSSRSSSESSYHGPSRLLEPDRGSLGSSPQLKARAGKLRACDSPSSLIFCRDGKRRGVPFSRTVSRVESFEDRSRPPFLALPLTKPRSISFPNADTSDYENIPAMNSDYENIQIPPRRPARAGTFTKLFEEQSRALSTANENDGYVDMSSFNAFESRQQSADPDAESAYTEPYKVCPVSAAAPREDLTSDEEPGSSEEEDSNPRDPSLAHKGEGQTRAHGIAQELLASERAYVDMLQHLDLDFHGAVLRALDEMDQEGKDSPGREELRCGLSELPALHRLHRGILQGLEARLLHRESQQKVADLFLARAEAFGHHTAHILQFDRYLGLLGETCLHSPRLAAAVREFEQQGLPGGGSVKYRLLRVVQRLFQYQVLLTDYLNNLCPDSAEYEDTQGALTLISSITDRANDSMEQGECLQKLVHIEHSVRGQGDLVQPGREFLKEGTLMKVAGRNRRPRHLFLMSDVLLYTYPQKDGKYRLKNTLKVADMKVSRPVMDKVPYALKIETPESCLTLCASSCAERDEWHSCLTRALPDDYKAQALAAFHHSVEIRERLGVSLGERPPTLVPVTHVMMCMNCGCDFSLTLRRHHCHACGKIVCRSCSRNKSPLKYLKGRLAKVCDGCYGELKRRGGGGPCLLRERPASMSFPLAAHRLSSSTFSSVLHSINPTTFRKQKKVPSALTEVAASGEGSAISGYLSRGKKGKKHWKKLWFVIKGKVLYTYMASEDTVAMESMPLLGFTIAPEKEEGGSGVGPVFHLYHKKTLFYSFKAEDANSAQRWIEAMENASVL